MSPTSNVTTEFMRLNGLATSNTDLEHDACLRKPNSYINESRGSARGSLNEKPLRRFKSQSTSEGVGSNPSDHA